MSSVVSWNIDNQLIIMHYMAFDHVLGNVVVRMKNFLIQELYMKSSVDRFIISISLFKVSDLY